MYLSDISQGSFQGRGICQKGAGYKKPPGYLQARGYEKAAHADGELFATGAQLPATAAYWTEGKVSAWLTVATHFLMVLFL